MSMKNYYDRCEVLRLAYAAKLQALQERYIQDREEAFKAYEQAKDDVLLEELNK